MTVSVPGARIVVASSASGQGKTTFACGLMQALVRRGLRVRACKCGPDYIDPMFHREVIGVPSRNLDLYFMGRNQTRALLADSLSGADIAIIEGAMGYYDGIAASDEASAWDVARVTESPAVLLVDGRARACSIAAEIAGFARFRAPSQIVGVVLNRVSPALYERLGELVESECGIVALGYIPPLEDCELESRHLGLVAAREVSGLERKIGRIADAVEKTVDIDRLLKLARMAPPLAYDPDPLPEPLAVPVTIAVARDAAFCFYYEDTLRLLKRLGARLVFFSPISDAALPKEAAGLYLGGGYPELHAAKLSANAPMRSSVRDAIAAGLPTIAECGGFMYLHDALKDDQGISRPMVGVIRGTSARAAGLSRFGYAQLTARRDGLLAKAGGSLRAHEFHYWDSDSPGDAFLARKPKSEREWECAHVSPSLYAGYPHLCLHAHPDAAARFARACAAYDGKRPTSADARGKRSAR